MENLDQESANEDGWEMDITDELAAAAKAAGVDVPTFIQSMEEVPEDLRQATVDLFNKGHRVAAKLKFNKIDGPEILFVLNDA